MTLNRWLLLIAALVGPTLGVLTLGNPQWNQWIYVCQAYWMARSQPSYTFTVSSSSTHTPTLSTTTGHGTVSFSGVSTSTPSVIAGLGSTSHISISSGTVLSMTPMIYLAPPSSFIGIWHDWDNTGKLIQLTKYDEKGNNIVIFNDTIDRRAEFGISVE